MVFEGVLSPVFDPLLALPMVWVVVIMAFLITCSPLILFQH